MPAPVITTINGYTKTFIGHLIERARDVQEQWAEADAARSDPQLVPPLLPDHLREALRRYRRDGGTQATGLTGSSVGLGVAGTAVARTQGRRIFR